MLLKIASFLIETLIGFFVFLTLLRFLLQTLRAPFRNPIGQFVITLTNWIVLPLRRVIPSVGQHDLASLVAAWLLVLVKIGLLCLLVLGTLPIGPLLIWSVLGLAADLLKLIMIIVFVQIVVSWINPHHPLGDVLNSLTRPFYRLFRFIKPVGQFDLSPFFLIIAIVVLLIVLNEMGPAGFAL